MAEMMPDFGGYDPQMLARWACNLEIFRWPVDFPVSPPAGWNAMNHRARILRCPEVERAYEAVAAAVPRDVVMAYWDGPFRAGEAADPWLHEPAPSPGRPGRG
jgi:hypothetical protein